MKKTCVCFVIIFLFLLQSCKKDNSTTNSRYGGVLRLEYSDPASNLDPVKILYGSDWMISSFVYEGLVGYSDKYEEIEPLIAQSWKISDSGKTFTFYLRDNCFFNNDACFGKSVNRKINAFDIKYTFERIADPESGCINNSLFENKIIGWQEFVNKESSEISGLKVLDSLTIQINLNEAYVTFLKILATPTAYIVAEEAIDYYGSRFYKHPVGTGPFRLVKWENNGELSLVKNYSYWKESDGRKTPFVDLVKIKSISDYSIKFTEFLKGQIDILSSSNIETKSLIAKPDFLKDYYIVTDTNRVHARFFGIDSRASSKLKNESIKKAIVLGYNRHKFLDQTGAKIAMSFVPEFMIGKTSSGYPKYSKSEQERLVGQLDYVTENSITIESTIHTDDLKELLKSCANIGLETKLNVQASKYYSRIIKEKPDIFRVSMQPSYPDPEEYYSFFYSGTGKNINLTGFKDEQFDRIFKRSLVEQNPIKRINLFHQLETIIAEKFPVILTSHQSDINYIMPKKVVGFKQRYLLPDIREVWINEG